MSFAELKKRKNSNKIEELKKASKSEDKNYTDVRFWSPTRDDAGNAFATIRFLPNKSDDGLPWVKYWDHFFKGPLGQWYIEKSLSTLGKDDPVGEENSRLWNTGVDDNKEIARKRKRRLHYVSNVYIVDDQGNPENNGKVMLYSYGKSVKDIIDDAMEPEFQDEKPIDPFHFWNGANFKLKIRKVDGWPKYDKSSFGSVEALFDTDEEIENVYNKLYDISEFVDPKSFKTYEQLKERFNRVLGLNNTRKIDPESETENFGNEEESNEMTSEASDVSTDMDDEMAFFRESLAS